MAARGAVSCNGVYCHPSNPPIQHYDFRVVWVLFWVLISIILIIVAFAIGVIVGMALHAASIELLAKEFLEWDENVEFTKLYNKNNSNLKKGQ